MNASRRKEIARAQSLLAEAQAIIAQAADDEQEEYDSMSEKRQESDVGERTIEYVTTLQEMADTLDDFANADFSE